MALVIGIVVSVLFYERLQLTTGGAIVPAYVVLALPHPIYIVATIGIALLTYLIVNKLIARRWILYGRRKFEVEIVVGLGLVSIAGGLAQFLRQTDPLLLGLTGIGMLIPGIIAHDMYRQDPWRTLLALAATAVIVAAAVYLYGSLLEISPFDESATPLVGNETGYPIELLLLGAIVSVLSGMVVNSVLGLRSGGYVSAAYLALFVVRPWDLVYTAVLALATWFVVTRLVMPRLLMFGRRKVSTMIMVGVILTWTAEEIVTHVSNGAFQPWKGFVLMSMMIPALLANDAQRQGVEKTLWGAAIATGAVYGVLNLVTVVPAAAGVG